MAPAIVITDPTALPIIEKPCPADRSGRDVTSDDQASERNRTKPVSETCVQYANEQVRLSPIAGAPDIVESKYLTLVSAMLLLHVADQNQLNRIAVLPCWF